MDSDSPPLGDDFTQSVINATGPAAPPRLRTVISALIRHLHDFARDVDLTMAEWLAGVELVNRAGRMSDDRRNEGLLLCDVLGLESLVDDITYRAATRSGRQPTASAILGPFWRHDAPLRENGSSISFDTPADAQMAFVHGRVVDADTNEPLVGATVDVWQASTNGFYEQQDENQVDYNLRGVFCTDEDGRYSFYGLRPTPYPVPIDGPAGELLKLLDRNEYRPGHIHFIVTADGYNTLTTQVYDRDSDFLDSDSVFAVKKGLTVTFNPRKDDPKAEWDLEYDVKLATAKKP